MNKEDIKRIFEDNNYIRTSASKEELKCANYFKDKINKLGLDAIIEPFEVDYSVIKNCKLSTPLGDIKATGYRLGGYTKIKAPLYYLRNKKEMQSLSLCKDKIVLMTGYFGRQVYEELVNNGALGFITTTGNVDDNHEDIDDRELRAVVSKDLIKLPGLNINIKDAVKLIDNKVEEVEIEIEGEDSKANSYNVIAKIDGELKEKIVFTAHYDSVPLSKGIYDNLSGAIGILALIEKFKDLKTRYSLEFVLCGSEERGLLGSKAYVTTKELDDIRLVINLDMIGSILGDNIACCTSEIALVNYIDYLAKEVGFPLHAYQDVYSSDSTPFADKGIPAVSFARLDPDMRMIHNRNDVIDIMSPDNLIEDIDFIFEFAKRMANAKYFMVKKTMPENMREKLDIYLLRKKPEDK